MYEFVIEGEKLQSLIVPKRYREEIDIKKPIKGALIVEKTILHFYSCQLDDVIFGTAIESNIDKKKVFISREFNKVFRLDPKQLYRVKLEDGIMTIYYYNGKPLLDLLGIFL